MRRALTIEITADDDAQVGGAMVAAKAAIEALGLTIERDEVLTVEPLTFTVVGVVKGKPSERWSEVVEASDAGEAVQMALDASDDPRSIAAILGGDVAAEVEAALAEVG